MNAADLPRVGNHVSLLNVSTGAFEPLGRLMGYGTSNGEPVGIVNLDRAVYTEGREHFVTNLVVHVSNLGVTR